MRWWLLPRELKEEEEEREEGCFHKGLSWQVADEVWAAQSSIWRGIVEKGLHPHSAVE